MNTTTQIKVIAAVIAVFAQTSNAQSWSSNGPAPRAFPTAVLDTVTNRTIVFSGYDTSSNLNDVWRLNNTGAANGFSWQRVWPSGTPPAARAGATSAYDPGSNRMIVFGGGLGNSSPCTSDVWALTNANGNGGTSSWVQLSPTGAAPPARHWHTAVYNSSTNTMTIFGGNDCFDTDYNDVWVLNNANGVSGTPAWTQLEPSGSAPAARSYASAVYDNTNNIMTICFGETQSGSYAVDVWTLSSANGTGGTPVWTQLSPSGGPPQARAGASAIYGVNNNRMIIFGGAGVLGLLNDTWVLAGANGLSGTPVWTQLGPFTFLPEARWAGSAVYNPSTDKMTILCGQVTGGDYTNDVFTLTHANGL